MEQNPINILIGVTGSVAALKLPILAKSLLDLKAHEPKYDFKIKLITTEHAKHFYHKTELPKEIDFYEDASEWDAWLDRGDPVVHIELGKWADLMVIAPIDANTLAKMSQGICDNLLTCTARAWDMSKPLLFCPAMNTRMWEHPITSKQISALEDWGYKQIPPISKKLMCGDTGVGGMAEVDTIVQIIKNVSDDIKKKKNK